MVTENTKMPELRKIARELGVNSSGLTKKELVENINRKHVQKEAYVVIRHALMISEKVAKVENTEEEAVEQLREFAKERGIYDCWFKIDSFLESKTYFGDFFWLVRRVRNTKEPV